MPILEENKEMVENKKEVNDESEPRLQSSNEEVSKGIKNISIEIKYHFNLFSNFVERLVNRQRSIYNRLYDGLRKKLNERKTRTYKKFLKEFGWAIDKKECTISDCWFELYKKLGDKKFKYTLNKWFYPKSNLNIVLKDVQTKFQERANIIEEGLIFHHKKNYACSITLLLPHTEGILWELGTKKKFVKKGYNSEKKYKKYFLNKELKEFKKNGAWAKWKLQDLSKQLFPKDKFHNIIVNTIFCEGPRNKILHGRNYKHKKQKEISRWISTLLILTLWRLCDEF